MVDSAGLTIPPVNPAEAAFSGRSPPVIPAYAGISGRYGRRRLSLAEIPASAGMTVK
jgi:hypothetical protein